jgi:16S rRNA (adenine1518-N6/adenine1519-N6)-dimethyltransferase
MAAAPGTPDYGSMTVFAQYHAQVEIVMTVSRRCFLPAPEVDSAVIRLTPQIPGAEDVTDEALFFKVVRAAFQQRRKTLTNTLQSGGLLPDRDSAESVLRSAGIDPSRRGETLSIQEFATIADRLHEITIEAAGREDE